MEKQCDVCGRIHGDKIKCAKWQRTPPETPPDKTVIYKVTWDAGANTPREKRFFAEDDADNFMKKINESAALLEISYIGIAKITTEEIE